MRVRPWMLGLGAIVLVAAGMPLASASPGATPQPGAPPNPGAFRAALLARAREDLDRVVETGRNSGPVIDEYLRAVREAPGANWCAAALSAWVRDAAKRLGIAPPFVGTSGAKHTGDLATRAAGARRVPRDQMSPSTVPSGSIVVFDRSVPGEPATDWQGHIGLLANWQGDKEFTSIEANSGARGDRVAEMSRTLLDPKLLYAVVI